VFAAKKDVLHKVGLSIVLSIPEFEEMAVHFLFKENL
jgi:hypothetical protein